MYHHDIAKVFKLQCFIYEMEVMREIIKVGEVIKVFFKYPNVNHIIIKSGEVISADDKSFILNEIKDGKTVYSYEFVVEARKQ